MTSSVPIQDIALKTYREQLTIEMGGERGSGISVLVAQHDDDDEYLINAFIIFWLCTPVCTYPTPCPVGWGCRIHRLLLCRGVRPPNECPECDTKQSDGEVLAMLELWGMRSTPSLPSLSGPLWPGVVVPDKGPIYGLNRTKSCFFHYTDFCI